MTIEPRNATKENPLDNRTACEIGTAICERLDTLIAIAERVLDTPQTPRPQAESPIPAGNTHENSAAKSKSKGSKS